MKRVHLRNYYREFSKDDSHAERKSRETDGRWLLSGIAKPKRLGYDGFARYSEEY